MGDKRVDAVIEGREGIGGDLISGSRWEMKDEQEIRDGMMEGGKPGKDGR